ncbi:MAG: XTP/dITP diphosphatase [Lactovum sp.]
MDNRPIGFLDSGLGGLTVVRQFFHCFPEENLIYIADTARMPYGSKSEAEILKFTREMVDFLLTKDVKLIIFACNTATAIALEEIQKEVKVPILGIIDSAVKGLLKSSNLNQIGLIATEATVRSKSYQKALNRVLLPSTKIQVLACPDFVPLVESGNYQGPEALACVEKTLEPLVGKVESLILACTHYPLLKKSIEKVMTNKVHLIDPAEEMMNQLSLLLNELGLRHDSSDKIEDIYYSTASPEIFKKQAEDILAKKIEVNSVSLEKKLLIASKNQGKIKEFQKIFNSLGYQIESLLDYPDLDDVEETGKTFEENAILKAETISKLTKRLVLADDSGLCVEALEGAPGIFSRRYAGEKATDEENNEKLLKVLSEFKDKEKRKAYFHCSLVLISPEGKKLSVEGRWDGYIAKQLEGKSGFGYDPLFLVAETGKTAAELMREEKNKISHRGQAIKKLIKEFPQWVERSYK